MSSLFAFSASTTFLGAELGVQEVQHEPLVRAAVRENAKERAATARARARWCRRAAWTFSGVAALAILRAGWRTRRDVRKWHWLSFLALALLVGTLVLSHYTRARSLHAFGLLMLLLAALVAVCIDLGRKRYGSPARPVAWTTLALVLFFTQWLVRDIVRNFS
ncbi:MAG TPA: hypothetical protein VFZ53_19785 [Polyangiaceae bacterium]